MRGVLSSHAQRKLLTVAISIGSTIREQEMMGMVIDVDVALADASTSICSCSRMVACAELVAGACD